MRVSREVAAVLESSTVDGALLKIGGHLQRDEYLAVDKVIKCMGGKWNRKLGGHVFPEDPTDLIESVILTGNVVDKKVELQFFETPAKVGRLLVQEAEIGPKDIILEPSAGHGAIVDEIRTWVPGFNERCLRDVHVVTAVEIDDAKTRKLEDRYGYPCWLHAITADFLQFRPPLMRWDRVLMNPPFSRQQDVAHFMHAYDLLKPGGILVAIMSEGAFFRETRAAGEFRLLLESARPGVSFAKLEPGSFKSSGTMVETRWVKIRKPL